MSEWAPALRLVLLLVVACGRHDTPVATYRSPLPEPLAGAGGDAPSAGASAVGGANAGANATSGAGAGGEAGNASSPACWQSYPLVVDGSSSRYKDVSTGAIWVDAERDCEADGGHLIVIDDPVENDWLQTIAELAVTDDASTHQLVWLGLGDSAIESEFVWVTGAALSSPRWASSEPNDLNDSEDCAELRASGDWNDDRCNAKLRYVCECDGLPSADDWCDTSQDATCGDCSTSCAAEQTCTSLKCQ